MTDICCLCCAVTSSAPSAVQCHIHGLVSRAEPQHKGRPPGRATWAAAARHSRWQGEAALLAPCCSAALGQPADSVAVLDSCRPCHSLGLHVVQQLPSRCRACPLIACAATQQQQGCRHLEAGLCASHKHPDGLIEQLRVQVRTLSQKQNKMLPVPLDHLPALELDCGGTYNILHDRDARQEFAKMVLLCSKQLPTNRLRCTARCKMLLVQLCPASSAAS